MVHQGMELRSTQNQKTPALTEHRLAPVCMGLTLSPETLIAKSDVRNVCPWNKSEQRLSRDKHYLPGSFS